MVFTKEQVLEYGALVGIEVSFIVGCFEFLILEVGMIFLAMIVPWVWLRLLLIVWSIFWIYSQIMKIYKQKELNILKIDSKLIDHLTERQKDFNRVWMFLAGSIILNLAVNCPHIFPILLDMLQWSVKELASKSYPF